MTALFLFTFLASLFNALISLFFSQKKQAHLMVSALTILACLASGLMVFFYNTLPGFNLFLFEVLPNVPIEFYGNTNGAIFNIMLGLLYPAAYQYTRYFFIKSEMELGRFFFFFHLSFLFATLLAFSANLFTMFICYEFITLVTYPMVTAYRNQESKQSGRKYLLYLAGTAAMFLIPFVILVYVDYGHLNFISQGGFLVYGKHSIIYNIILVLLFVYGVGKFAIPPLNGWLPAAMVAPTPVSAILHAVIVVKSGAFMVITVSYYLIGEKFIDQLPRFFGSNMLSYIGAFGVLYASMRAVFATNIKTRLAFSTISNLMYCLLAISADRVPHQAAMIQFVSHSIAKIILFYIAGLSYLHNKDYQIKNLPNIVYGSKSSFVALCVAMISLMGIWPLAGYQFKHMLLAQEPSYGVINIVSSIGAILADIYLFEILWRFIVSKERKKWPVSNIVKITMLYLSALSLLFSGIVYFYF